MIFCHFYFFQCCISDGKSPFNCTEPCLCVSPKICQYPKLLSFWGHFLVPMRKQAYKLYRIKFFENQKKFPISGRFRFRGME